MWRERQERFKTEEDGERAAAEGEQGCTHGHRIVKVITQFILLQLQDKLQKSSGQVLRSGLRARATGCLHAATLPGRNARNGRGGLKLRGIQRA